MKRPRDSQRSKLYKAEDCAPKGEQFETVAECQAYVDRITASAWWCTYQVPWIEKDPPRSSAIYGIEPGERSPAQRYGWGGDAKSSPKRTKGIIPCRDESRPVVQVLDGRGRRSACARGNTISLPKWARNERTIIHELAHVVATERPAHGRQFALIFLDMMKRFHSDPDAWQVMKCAFQNDKVRYKKKRKGNPNNLGLVKFREIAAARRAGKDALKELPLYPGAQPCLRSGYCCKRRPCSFGRWNSDETRCEHLAGDRPGEYACAIAAEIVRRPGWEMEPAFGAGCCSSLNSDRIGLKKKVQE